MAPSCLLLALALCHVAASLRERHFQLGPSWLRASRARAAAHSEGDVVVRTDKKELSLLSMGERRQLPHVDTFFAFDSALNMVRRRAVVRRSLAQLKEFMDGEDGREKIAWRFFSDDELPDARFVRQPRENRKPRGAEPVQRMLDRWLFDLSWSLEHLDFAWLVRADDDGVLCPRNFARLRAGLRTLKPRRKEEEAVERSWLEPWTERALQGMHEDYPRSTLVLSAPCRGIEAGERQQWRCRPSAEEQFRRKVRMFDVMTVFGDDEDEDFSFSSGWEENFLMMSPEFIEDLLDKVDSSEKCRPRPKENIDTFFGRLVEGDCSGRRWPKELTVANIGRYDMGDLDGGGFADWGHSVWDSSSNYVYKHYRTLREFQLACEANDMVWFHHVRSKTMKDVSVPESLEWLDEIPDPYYDQKYNGD